MMTCQENFDLFQAFVAHEQITGTHNTWMNTVDGTAVKMIEVVLVGICFGLCPTQAAFIILQGNEFLFGSVLAFQLLLACLGC